MQVAGQLVEWRARAEHGVVLVLQVDRVEVVPTVLEPDSNPDINENRVLVQRVLEHRQQRPVTSDADREQKKIRDPDVRQVSVPNGEAQRPLYSSVLLRRFGRKSPDRRPSSRRQERSVSPILPAPGAPTQRACRQT